MIVHQEPCLFALARVPERKASYDHEAAQELAHGDGSQDKADLRIRFPEEFNNESEHAITTQKKGEHGAVRPGSTLW